MTNAELNAKKTPAYSAYKKWEKDNYKKVEAALDFIPTAFSHH